MECDKCGKEITGRIFKKYIKNLCEKCNKIITTIKWDRTDKIQNYRNRTELNK